VNSLAQEYDIEEANELLTSKSYLEAIPAFKKLLSVENSANLNYKLGLCYFNLNKEIESIPYFEQAIKDTYKKYSITNTSLLYAPTDAYYYLAKANHVKGNLSVAFNFYNKFYANSKKRNPLKHKSYIGILQCEVANRQRKNITTDIIWRLSDTINTNLEESSPVVSLNGTTIYFTSSKLRKDNSNHLFTDPNTGSYFKDIYTSDQTETGDWTKPKILDICKPNQNESPSSISPNGNQLLINSGDFSKNNIYKSTISSSKYSESSPFQQNI